MKEKKLYYVEILRIIAIFFVVFNHTRNLGYSLYQEVEQGFFYYASLSMSILCKIAVPVFFMISGGLLLGRKETFKELFSKRILRYAVVILLFTFLQYLRTVRVHPEEGFHPSTWLLYCYAGNIIEPYWFLKSYFSMLLILPFLRLLASVMNKRDYMLLIGMKAVVTVISLIYIYTGYAANITFPFHADIIFYPLTGYFLMNVLEQDKYRFLKSRNLAAFLLAFLVLAVFQARTFFVFHGTYSEEFHSLYVWILAMLTLLLVKKIEIRTPVIQRIICAMGSCVFGVYLIEDVVRNQVQRIVSAIAPVLGRLGGMVLTLLSVLAAMLIIYCVKKIPMVRKLI